MAIFIKILEKFELSFRRYGGFLGSDIGLLSGTGVEAPALFELRNHTAKSRKVAFGAHRRSRPHRDPLPPSFAGCNKSLYQRTVYRIICKVHYK